MNFFPEKKQSDYIKIYENVLSPEDCKKAIKIIEEVSIEDLKVMRKKQGMDFWVHYVDDSDLEFSKQLDSMFLDLYKRYIKDLDISPQVPTDPNFSRVKVKRYDKKSGDCFPPHVDVMDEISSRRYVAMLLYLNDVEEGGETVFECMDEPIKPKVGRCAVFPPLWMFRHKGRPAFSENKYSMQVYARYAPRVKK